MIADNEGFIRYANKSVVCSGASGRPAAVPSFDAGSSAPTSSSTAIRTTSAALSRMKQAHRANVLFGPLASG
jgi:hypothetical protein